MPPSFLELGLADMVSIYSELCEAGKPPPVIDAADLQAAPEVESAVSLIFLGNCAFLFLLYILNLAS